MLEQAQNIREGETFSDLWRDDFLLVTGKVAHRSLCRLGLEPYSCSVLKRGLKVRSATTDRENNEGLDRAMEYTGVVGVELVEMLASINLRLLAIEPRMPAQHTFGGNGLQNFICDHQDHMEWLEDQLGDLITMMEHTI